MTPEQITSLGEAAAKSAQRAIRKADQVGVDQNRGQFVRMVVMALEAIPEKIGEFVVEYGQDLSQPIGNVATLPCGHQLNIRKRT